MVYYIHLVESGKEIPYHLTYFFYLVKSYVDFYLKLKRNLMFADDIMIFGRAKAAEIDALKRILDKFQNSTGQKTNLDKSKVILPPSVHGPLRKFVLASLNMDKFQKVSLTWVFLYFGGETRSDGFNP